MRLCLSLAQMCEESPEPVVLRKNGQPALTIHRRPGEDGDWQVTDWTADRVRSYSEPNSYAAAMLCFDILGFDARRVLQPIISRWRYKSLFPLGSSLEWTPTPINAWSPPLLWAPDPLPLLLVLPPANKPARRAARASV